MLLFPAGLVDVLENELQPSVCKCWVVECTQGSGAELSCCFWQLHLLSSAAKQNFKAVRPSNTTWWNLHLKHGTPVKSCPEKLPWRMQILLHGIDGAKAAIKATCEKLPSATCTMTYSEKPPLLAFSSARQFTLSQLSHCIMSFKPPPELTFGDSKHCWLHKKSWERKGQVD